MPYQKIWGSLSLLIGAVIAVLALVRGSWQQWLLLAVIAVWAPLAGADSSASLCRSQAAVA